MDDHVNGVIHDTQRSILFVEQRRELQDSPKDIRAVPL
jgi:hypothetical protein